MHFPRQKLPHLCTEHQSRAVQAAERRAGAGPLLCGLPAAQQNLCGPRSREESCHCSGLAEAGVGNREKTLAASQSRAGGEGGQPHGPALVSASLGTRVLVSPIPVVVRRCRCSHTLWVRHWDRAPGARGVRVARDPGGACPETRLGQLLVLLAGFVKASCSIVATQASLVKFQCFFC